MRVDGVSATNSIMASIDMSLHSAHSRVIPKLANLQQFSQASGASSCFINNGFPLLGSNQPSVAMQRSIARPSSGSQLRRRFQRAGRRWLSSSAAVLFLAAQMASPPTKASLKLEAESVAVGFSDPAKVLSPLRGGGGSMPPSEEFSRLLPIFILSGALATYGIIAAYVTAQEGVGPASWWTIESATSRMPLSFSLFLAADLVAQTIEKKPSLDMKRLLSAGCIGGLLNGAGFAFWLHYVEAAFPLPPPPESGVTLPMASQFFAKACLDNFVWGTVSNCVGLTLRRIAAGDSPHEARCVWMERYTGVFVNGYKFWPFWQSLTYSVVPSEYRVHFVAVGAFIWNTYLSLKSSKPAESSASDE